MAKNRGAAAPSIFCTVYTRTQKPQGATNEIAARNKEKYNLFLVSGGELKILVNECQKKTQLAAGTQQKTGIFVYNNLLKLFIRTCGL